MIAQPNLTWGISTMGCHEQTLEEIGELAAWHNIKTLEIRSLAGRMDLPAYFDETYGQPGEIQTVLDRHRLQIIALNSSFNLIKANDESRAELLEFARWAELLDIPYIRVFGGGSMAEELSTEDLDHAAASLDWWNTLRTKNGWSTQLAMETHDGFSSGARCRQLCEYIEGTLDIIWDTHHTWKLGGESPQETWDAIAPIIRHVHIKDSLPEPSARHPYTYVLPGTGEFPAHDILQLLHKQNYTGIVSLEWERQWHPYLPTLDEALQASQTANWRTRSGAPLREFR